MRPYALVYNDTENVKSPALTDITVEPANLQGAITYHAVLNGMPCMDSNDKFDCFDPMQGSTRRQGVGRIRSMA